MLHEDIMQLAKT